MIKRNLFKKTASAFALAALAVGSLASCSQDMPNPGPNPGPLEKETTYYLNFKVGGGNSLTQTRADGFDNGEGRESVVNNIFLVFYDAAGKVVGEPISAEEGAYIEIKPNTSDWKTINAGGSVEKYYNEVVKLDLLRGQSLPAYVMCFINPTVKNIGTKTLSQIENEMISTYGYEADADPDRGVTAGFVFTMNNSVYYDDDPIAGQSRALVRAVPIPAESLKRTEEEARDDSNATLNIYVERRAAKLKVSRSTDASNQFNDAALGFDFEFVPEKWALNCYEKTSFLTKNYRQTGDLITGGGGLGATNYTWELLLDRMGANDPVSNWQWNAKSMNRSFWALSPGYYATDFPLVSDDVKDKTIIPIVDNSDKYINGYYSYNDIIGSKGAELNNTTYHLENTLGVNAIENASNILAAIPSVVLVGKNKMKLGGTAIEINGKTPTFYRRANRLYFNDDQLTTLKALVAETYQNRFVGIMQAMASGINLLYIQAADGTYQPVSDLTYQELKSIFEIEHPTKDVRGDVAVPERNVTLQLLDIDKLIWTPDYELRTSNGKTVYVRNGQNVQPVTKDNYLVINRELVSRAGYAETYTDGMAFYNVPVKHLGWYSELNKDRDKNDLSTFDWNNVKVGWFGLVRNHSYIMELGNIIRLGTGILDPDQPIIPDKQKENYFINYTINVLQWRVVPTQRPIL